MAFRQNGLCAGGGASRYALADSLYAAADYEAAQPLWIAAGEALEMSGAVDSAARAYYYGAKCDWQRSDVAALRAYVSTVLDPAMARINTDLARAYVSQVRGDIAFRSYEFAEGYQQLQSAFRDFQLAKALRFDEVISNRTLVAVMSSQIGQPIDSAIAFAQQAVRIAERHHAPCSKAVAYAYLSLASNFYVKEDMASSLFAYQLAYQVFTEVLPPHHPHLVVVNTSLAQMHAEMGHPEKALYFSDVAIGHAELGDEYGKGDAYYRYANVLAALGLPVQASSWFSKSRDIYRGAPEEYKILESIIVRDMIRNYSQMGEGSSAEAMLDTLALIHSQYGELAAEGMPGLYATRGEYYHTEGQFEQSLQAYREAISWARVKLGDDLYFFRQTYQGFSYVLLDAGMVDSAQHYYTLAQPRIVDAEQETLSWVIDFKLLGVRIATAQLDYPTAAARLREILADFTTNSRPGKTQPYALDVVQAARELFRRSGTTQHRQLFLQSVRFTDQLLTEHYGLLALERWTPTFIDGLREVYTAAAFAAATECSDRREAGDLRGDWCTTAIRYADLPRALALRRRGAELAAGLRAGIPDSLIERGQYLQRRQAALQHSEMDSTRRARESRGLQREIAEYETNLRFRHPQYYQSVLSPFALDVAELRRRARSDDALFVSYLIDTSLARALVCVIDGSQRDELAVVAHGAVQIATITDFKTELANRRSERLAALSTAIYDGYLRPILPNDRGKSTLTIASDGELAGLPFAALLLSTPPASAKMAQWPWLGLQYHVSYVDALASTQVVDDARQIERPGGEGLSVACVAPGFDASTLSTQAVSTGLGGASETLLRTPWTLAFGKLLGERYGADVLTAEGATERALVRSYATHDILHLGTHAFLDDGDPLRSYFALTPTSAARDDDGRLYAYEIYGLPTQARLAVLPACGSGAGAFQSGEGTLSLATAFRNSGCPTVVQSFWSIDDQQTNVLLEPFYAHLAGGEPVAAALAAAQRDYLAAAPPELQHPYYWAGLAVVGPEVSFGESRSPWLYAAVALFGLCVAGALVWWRF